MSASNQFSCYVIGETTLALQCCEKLLERGHAVCGIISPNPEIAAWAEQRGIPSGAPPWAFNGLLHSRPCDYLFSIVNNAVLPPELLSLPRRMAINFHDAPLPRYGGIHATSWAIMNREQAHGITWHEMTPQIDAGGVLKQKLIPVAPADTALSLNLRCYKQAVEAFEELIDELAAGSAVSLPQDISQRTYFARYRRPELGCLIDWSAQAAGIEAFVRSLDFGPYPNALGLAKIRVGSDYYIVSRLEKFTGRSTAAPGTVMATEGGLTVATGDFDVRITGLAKLEGQPCRTEDFVCQAGIRPGCRLMPPDEQLSGRLTKLYNETCRYEAFWLAELRGLNPLTLPDMRLYAQSSAAAGTVLYSLQAQPELICSALQLLPGAKPWQVLCAAFAAFLARHTGAGAVHLGFHDVALDEKISGLEGFFASCLPLRLDVAVQQPLASFCRTVIEKLSSMERCGTYPRDLAARQPDLRELAGRSLQVRVRHARSLAELHCTSDAALELILTDEGDCLLRIDTAVIDAAYAASVKNQLAAFLAGAAAGFTLPLEELPLAGRALRLDLVEGLNATAAAFDKTVCMHELFERQAAARPQAVATVFDGSERSYGELNRQANALAWRLKSDGVGRGCLVGICLDRGHDMIAALIAVLKAGGAYVPLEPGYPAERIETIVRSAGITAIVSQEKYAARAVHSGVRTILIDGPRPAGGPVPEADNPPRAALPDDLAYIIYTSGSTGAPKGVMVSHRPFINLFEWCCRTCGFGPDDSVLFTTSLGFDLSVFDIFGMLGCGGRIYIAGEAERRDAARLARMLCTQEITFWDSAPAALQLLVPALKAQPRPAANTKLRLVFLSGDWIPLTLPDDVREVFPGAQVMSLGGATEATVWSNFFPVNRVEPHWRSIPYGRPIQNSRYYILDRRLEPCPPGVAGDLYIAGECLSLGYRNEHELTGRSFLPDPFSADEGGRMYRTGDLARFFPDGTMEFLGRSDFQVKVRGYRIELGEIEHVLRRHPAVKEAVAAVQQGAAGDQKLVAYLTGAGGPAPASRELRTHAGNFLAEYMVPNLFVWLDAMPVTANGKLDRRQLPWPVGEPAACDREAPQAQQPDLEAILSACFREVLAVAAIAPTEDFFDLGVTSLNLIQIAERLHAEYGLEVPVEAFLDHPSIAALAAGLQEHLPVSTAEPAVRKPCSQAPAEAGPPPCLPAAVPSAAATGAVREVLGAMQIVLPAEAFADAAVLEDITARVRRLFAECRITPAAAAAPAPASCCGAPAGLQAKPAAPRAGAQLDRLAATFSGVLRVASIPPEADFFDLGVTSLNLIEIAERLHAEHGLEVPVEVFLEHSTLHSLAAYLDSSAPVADTSLPCVAAEPSFPAAGRIALEAASFDPAAYGASLGRRTFGEGALALRSLSRLLGLLKQEIVQGQPKYLYASAGGLNAVQTYVWARSVEGLAEGIYYYHPVRHQLIAVNKGAALPRDIMAPADRQVFDESGFCVFFIAQLAALQPVYNCLSPALAVLDAGYMTQLLMSRQDRSGLGLCLLAGTDFSRVLDLFSLEESHLFLCCLAGGPAGGRFEAAPAFGSAGLAGHFAGSAPDWESLKAVSTGRLDCLNALTAQQHEELHRSEPHLRRFPPGEPGISLQPVSFLHNQYLLRSTQRSFAGRPVSFSSFSRFLALLKRQPRQEGFAALYHEPAGAGSLQFFLHVQPGAVERVPEGIYRYDPVGHDLSALSTAPAAGLRQAHFPRNRTYFAEAAFSIFCMAQLDQLEPLFGSQGFELAMLEAGCAGQLLMDHQAEFGMGVCPIGSLRFEGLRSLFGLGPRQVLLHSFLCGPVERSLSLAGLECLKPV